MKKEPLIKYREFLVWYSVYPADENTPKWKKCAHIMSSCLICFIHLIATECSVAYLIKYLSVDLEKSLYAILQIVACFSAFYACIVMWLTRQKVTKMFENLSKIYNKCKTFLHENSHCLLNSTNSDDFSENKFLIQGNFSYFTQNP